MVHSTAAVIGPGAAFAPTPNRRESPDFPMAREAHHLIGLPAMLGSRISWAIRLKKDQPRQMSGHTLGVMRGESGRDRAWSQGDEFRPDVLVGGDP